MRKKVEIDLDLSGVPEFIIEQMKEVNGYGDRDIGVTIQRAIEDLARKNPDLAKEMFGSLERVGRNQYQPGEVDPDIAANFEDMMRTLFRGYVEGGLGAAGIYDELDFGEVAEAVQSLSDLTEGIDNEEIAKATEEIVDKFTQLSVIDLDNFSDQVKNLKEAFRNSGEDIAEVFEKVSETADKLALRKKSIDSALDGFIQSGPSPIDEWRAGVQDSNSPTAPLGRAILGTQLGSRVAGSSAAATTASVASKAIPYVGAVTALAGTAYGVADQLAQERRAYTEIGGETSVRDIAEDSFQTRLRSANLGISQSEAESLSEGIRATGVRGSAADKGVDFGVDNVRSGLLNAQEAIDVFALATRRGSVNLEQVSTDLQILSKTAGETDASFQEMKKNYLDTVALAEETGAGEQTGTVAAAQANIANTISTDPGISNALTPVFNPEAGTYGSGLLNQLAASRFGDQIPEAAFLQPGALKGAVIEAGGQEGFERLMFDYLYQIFSQAGSIESADDDVTQLEILKQEYGFAGNLQDMEDVAEQLLQGPEALAGASQQNYLDGLTDAAGIGLIGDTGTQFDGADIGLLDRLQGDYTGIEQIIRENVGVRNPFDPDERFLGSVGDRLSRIASNGGQVSPIFASLLSNPELRKYSITREGQPVTLGEAFEDTTDEELRLLVNAIGSGEVPIYQYDEEEGLSSDATYAQDIRLPGFSGTDLSYASQEARDEDLAGLDDLGFDTNPRDQQFLPEDVVIGGGTIAQRQQVEVLLTVDAPPYLEGLFRLGENANYDRQGYYGAFEAEAANRGQ